MALEDANTMTGAIMGAIRQTQLRKKQLDKDSKLATALIRNKPELLKGTQWEGDPDGFAMADAKTKVGVLETALKATYLTDALDDIANERWTEKVARQDRRAGGKLFELLGAPRADGQPPNVQQLLSDARYAGVKDPGMLSQLLPAITSLQQQQMVGERSRLADYAEAEQQQRDSEFVRAINKLGSQGELTSQNFNLAAASLGPSPDVQTKMRPSIKDPEPDPYPNVDWTPEQVSGLTALNKELRASPQITGYNQVKNAYAQLVDFVTTNPTGAKDAATLYKIITSLDPNSAVREGEMSLMERITPLANWVEHKTGGVMKGRILIDDVAKDLLEVANYAVNVYADEARSAVKDYKTQAERVLGVPAASDAIFGPEIPDHTPLEVKKKVGDLEIPWIRNQNGEGFAPTSQRELEAVPAGAMVWDYKTNQWMRRN